MANLDITNIINISIAQPQAGLNTYNTSNLALATEEVSEATFGTGTFKSYASPTEVQEDFGTTSKTYQMALSVFSQQPNILRGNGRLIVIKRTTGETLDDLITRTSASIEYLGIISTELESQTNTIAAAAVAQTQRKILGVVSRTATHLDDDDFFDTVRTSGYTHTRCLYYGSTTDQPALNFMAAYFSRALSTNFNAVLSTQTMHLKDLIGIPPDTTLTSAQIDAAQKVGADLYVNIGGVSGIPKVYTSGANDFFR